MVFFDHTIWRGAKNATLPLDGIAKGHRSNGPGRSQALRGRIAVITPGAGKVPGLSRQQGGFQRRRRKLAGLQGFQRKARHCGRRDSLVRGSEKREAALTALLARTPVRPAGRLTTPVRSKNGTLYDRSLD